MTDRQSRARRRAAGAGGEGHGHGPDRRGAPAPVPRSGGDRHGRGAQRRARNDRRRPRALARDGGRGALDAGATGGAHGRARALCPRVARDPGRERLRRGRPRRGDVHAVARGGDGLRRREQPGVRPRRLPPGQRVLQGPREDLRALPRGRGDGVARARPGAVHGHRAVLPARLPRAPRQRVDPGSRGRRGEARRRRLGRRRRMRSRGVDDPDGRGVPRRRRPRVRLPRRARSSGHASSPATRA